MAASAAVSAAAGAGPPYMIPSGPAPTPRRYAWALYSDDCATVDDIREAVTILEDMERTARRNYGTAHPMTRTTGECLRNAQETLRAREAPATA